MWPAGLDSTAHALQVIYGHSRTGVIKDVDPDIGAFPRIIIWLQFNCYLVSLCIDYIAMAYAVYADLLCNGLIWRLAQGSLYLFAPCTPLA